MTNSSISTLLLVLLLKRTFTSALLQESSSLSFHNNDKYHFYVARDGRRIHSSPQTVAHPRVLTNGKGRIEITASSSSCLQYFIIFESQTTGTYHFNMNEDSRSWCRSDLHQNTTLHNTTLHNTTPWLRHHDIANTCTLRAIVFITNRSNIMFSSCSQESSHFHTFRYASSAPNYQ